MKSAIDAEQAAQHDADGSNPLYPPYFKGDRKRSDPYLKVSLLKARPERSRRSKLRLTNLTPDSRLLTNSN